MAMTCKILFVLTLATVKSQMLDHIHRDLVAMNASCSVGGFCDGSDYRSKENCYCDDLCAEYGDCCPDAVHYKREDQVRPERYRCVSVGYRSVYMKDTCMSGWQDEEVAQLCLAGSPADISSSRDPLAHLPATSNTTSVTYTNYYCAICNNDSHHLTLWTTQLECDPEYYPDQPDNLTEYITSHLLFANGNGRARIPLNNTVIFKKCNINIKFPHIPVITRACYSTIRSCAENWTDASVAALCHSYTAVRYVGDLAYRNPHCLLCNLKNSSNGRCWLHDVLKEVPPPALLPSFFDTNDLSGSNTVGLTNTCQSGEFYDKRLKKCRNKGSYVNETRTGDKYIDVDSSDAPTCSLYITGSNRAKCEFKEIHKCEKILISKGKFTLYENRTVCVGLFDQWYQAGEYEITNDGVWVCLPKAPTEKFSPVMGWVSLAGFGLSCLCLLLHLAAFLLVPRLRNLPGKSLASLCLSLLTAYTIFIFSTFLEPRMTGCYISAVLMYYSFLASFCWMNIMAFDVWLTFRQAKDELRVSSGRQRSKFLFYCVYGWLLPALAVVVTVTLDKTAPAGLPSEFRPNFGQCWCWFGKRKALMVFFVAPLIVVMALNVVFFLFTSYSIGTSREPTLRRNSSSQNKKQFLLYVRLAVLMGLSWISGIVADYLQLEAVWYVFVVLNTLQGVFIFLTFTCRSKVWRAVREFCFKEAKSRPGKSMTPPGPNLTSDTIDSSRISIDTELSSM
ncbi:uncharacterized protein [Procambarus clarkii]|uniref:uncharacterized protein n=1 Tax=Procambarus clarkii TaxID=6728 RepID=UPI00374381F4